MKYFLFSNLTFVLLEMSIPPYLLGPNPWATMMAQQHLAAAHAQAQVAAAQAHAHALQQQIPPPHPKSDVMTEDKLQEKGINPNVHICQLLNLTNIINLY